MTYHTQKAIKHKIGLLNLAEELKNVAQACRVMGVSRDTFYRYQQLVQEGGVEALIEQSRRKPLHANRLDETTEKAICDYALEFPAHGQERARNELVKRGFQISANGVRCVWLRHHLNNFKLRLRALEEHVAKTNAILTEGQIQALEKKKLDDGVIGEIETEHPGYLGSQDTFYVGTIKGVGRIYQQTFVDTYSKVAFAKLYTSKKPLSAADLLNDRVLPHFNQHDIPLLRILTDRGTEYCGRLEQHEFQIYCALNGIEHTKTKARHPQTNGICERFHKTILQEFYQVTFRKKLYKTLDELQADLDVWLDYYNADRTHQGKMCCGRTPTETFNDGLKICQEKIKD